jgi:hypothetical protein
MMKAAVKYGIVDKPIATLKNTASLVPYWEELRYIWLL